jgi:S1-C subfamily serine protease
MRLGIASAASLAALLAAANPSRADSFREVGRRPPLAGRASPVAATLSAATTLPAERASLPSGQRDAAGRDIAQPAMAKPHPAVVRVIVPEKGSTSYGSGTLVDVHGRYGLVVTNWHVVKDASAAPTVLFPDYFQSAAHVVKVDRIWDLAALVVWRPEVAPAPLAGEAPRPGEPLFIAGYGQGLYQQAAGRCTKYWMPAEGYPKEMVELTADARQGDSGGPIFNDRGELAGVLWGAGGGMTMGSYCGRVRQFLASVVPQDAQDELVDTAVRPAGGSDHDVGPRSAQSADAAVWATADDGWRPARSASLAVRPETPIAVEPAQSGVSPGASLAADSKEPASATSSFDWRSLAGRTRPEQGKTLLAVIGAVAIVARIRRARRGAQPAGPAPRAP